MSDQQEFGWGSWKRVDRTEASNLLTQLKMEVGRRHLLWNSLQGSEVLARDSASDDILIEASEDKSVAFFVVHLTWSQASDAGGSFPSVVELELASVPKEFRLVG